MGIIISDMEMPKVCFDCPCHDGEWDRCNITKKPIGLYDETRPQDCPLKEAESVPTADVMPRTKQAAIDYLEEIGWMEEHDREITTATRNFVGLQY